MKPTVTRGKLKSKTARTQKKKSKGHTIKFSLETEKLINAMREIRDQKRSFNNMVEYLVENNAAFIFYSENFKE